MRRVVEVEPGREVLYARAVVACDGRWAAAFADGALLYAAYHLVVILRV